VRLKINKYMMARFGIFRINMGDDIKMFFFYFEHDIRKDNTKISFVLITV